MEIRTYEWHEQRSSREDTNYSDNLRRLARVIREEVSPGEVLRIPLGNFSDDYLNRGKKDANRLKEDLLGIVFGANLSVVVGRTIPCMNGLGYSTKLSLDAYKYMERVK